MIYSPSFLLICLMMLFDSAILYHWYLLCFFCINTIITPCYNSLYSSFMMPFDSTILHQWYLFCFSLCVSAFNLLYLFIILCDNCPFIFTHLSIIFSFNLHNCLFTSSFVDAFQQYHFVSLIFVCSYVFLHYYHCHYLFTPLAVALPVIVVF